jgi:hypothetical protein
MITSHSDSLEEIIVAHQKAESFRSANTTNRYPKEFKDKVKMALERGVSTHKIHRATGMSLATICSWAKTLYERDKLVCFEAVRKPKEKDQDGRIILSSGIEIVVPLDFIEKKLSELIGRGAT